MASIFKDLKFKNKIGLKGYSSSEVGQKVFGYATWKGAKSNQVWTFAEWTSKHLFKDDLKEEAIDDYINFCNDAKSVKLYPGKGKIELSVDTRKEYIERHRETGEGWVHLLLEQAVEPEGRVHLSKITKLYAELSFTINRCNIYMKPEEFKPCLHSAQLSWFFTVENNSGKVFDVEGRPDYLWFGLPLFDFRYGNIQGPQVFLDHGTQKVIYGMNRSDYIPEIVEVGKTYSIKHDILSEIKKAFNIAKQQGWLKGAKWEDMVIGSTNIGWEVPGTFDCQVTMKNLSVNYEK